MNRQTIIRILCNLLLSLFLSIHAKGQIDNKYAFVDNKYAKVPASETNNVDELALYLTSTLNTDDEKVRSIYTWICHNIKYDFKAYDKCKIVDYTPEKVLKHKKAMCEGYAILFKALCDAVHIKAVKIDGYAKANEFDIGEYLYAPEHSWNAVMIDGEWKLIDATWGAGSRGVKPTFVRKTLHKIIPQIQPWQHKSHFMFDYNDHFFCTPPSTFIIDHNPEDPRWQLLPEELPMDIFIKGDSDIVHYEKSKNLITSSTLITDLPDPESKETVKIMEKCDRAYAYNDRYNSVMAEKEVTIGDELVIDSLSSKNLPIMKERIKQHYLTAIEYLKCNKSGLDEKYKQMNTDNSGKKTQLTQDNKILKRINTYTEAKSLSNYKGSQVMLENLYLKTESIIAKGPPSAGNLIAQSDDGKGKTTERRDKLFETLHKSAKEVKRLRIATEIKKSKVLFWQNGLKSCLDSIRMGVTRGDSLLNYEIIYRLNRFDSYKLPVIELRKEQIHNKQFVDSVYAHMFYGYIDSIKINERDINNNLRTMISILKDEDASIRQEPALVNKTLSTWFNESEDTMVNMYSEEVTRYNNQLNFWEQIVPFYKPILGVFKKQDKSLKLMEKLEKKRFTYMKNFFELKKKKEVEMNQNNIEIIKEKINNLKKIKISD